MVSQLALDSHTGNSARRGSGHREYRHHAHLGPFRDTAYHSAALVPFLQEYDWQEQLLLGRWQAMLSELHAVATPDFAMFAVANRELLDLAQSSLH